MDNSESKKIYNKYVDATRRQHFVKIEYLSKWSVDGKNILGKKTGNKEFTLFNLSDVCVCNDIYTIDHHFNEIELSLLKHFYAGYPQYIRNELDNLIELRQFQTSQNFLKITNELENGERLNKGFQRQSGEDNQTRIESLFFEIVRKNIIACDDSFLDDINVRTTFILGLATQYIRTNKMRVLLKTGIHSLIDDFRSRMENPDILNNINPEALWKGMLEILPFLITYQMNREKSGIEFLHSDYLFITSDNPVVHIGDRDENGLSKNIKFLYPVSPNLCIVFPAKTCEKSLNKKETEAINKIIKRESHLFIFKFK